MAEFTVTSSQVKEKEGELQNLNASYKTKVDSLEQIVSELAGMWEGEAHDVFHSTFEKDKTQLWNFYNAIEKYCATLLEIAQTYEKAEQQNIMTASGKG
jgi:WXG100 family type VII secretion target